MGAMEIIEENEKIVVLKDGKEVDAKRIFGVMGLGVKCGQEITLKTDGEKEEEAMETLSKFLEEKFEFKDSLPLRKLFQKN